MKYTDLSTTDFPKTLNIKNHKGGAVWQVYHVKTQEEVDFDNYEIFEFTEDCLKIEHTWDIFALMHACMCMCVCIVQVCYHDYYYAPSPSPLP